MKQSRTVTRTWTNKQGETVTRTYTYGINYSGRRKQKAKILTSTGKLVKSNYNKLVANMSIADKSEIQAVIDLYQRQHKGVLTETRLKAIVAHNRIASTIDNTGLTISQVCEELGVTETNLLNENNWERDVFTDPSSGKSWRFQFNYSGEVFIKL